VCCPWQMTRRGRVLLGRLDLAASWLDKSGGGGGGGYTVAAGRGFGPAEPRQFDDAVALHSYLPNKVKSERSAKKGQEQLTISSSAAAALFGQWKPRAIIILFDTFLPAKTAKLYPPMPLMSPCMNPSSHSCTGILSAS